MAEKKEKRVKNKRPMAGWALWLLKLTQHISVCVAALGAASAILIGSVYVEDYGGFRVTLNFSTESNEEKAQQYLYNRLQDDTYNAIRLATIRSQLETDGKFDLKKQINVSEYYYRKNGNSASNQSYFELAVYELEDLLRWQQSGGLRYLDAVANSGSDMNLVRYEILAKESAQEAALDLEILETMPATASVGESEWASGAVAVAESMQDDIVTSVENMFLTVDGLRLEHIVSTETEYQELCKQLASCMSELNTNFQDYQSYMKEFSEGNTSFVYYVKMDNAAGDVYTNLSKLEGYSKSKLEEYFNKLVCNAAGTTALYNGIQGEFDVSQEEIKEYISEFSYAFGNSALVYAGYDLSLGVDDYYSTVWQAYNSYNTESMYMLIGIIAGCALYYVFITLYLLYASGRKMDKDGHEYIELKWNDSIYTEVFLAWCVVLGFGIAFACSEFYDHFCFVPENYISLAAAIIISAAGFLLSVFTTEALCSLSRRIKAGTLIKNSLIYILCVTQLVRFCRFIKRKWSGLSKRIQYYVEHAGLWERTWGILLVEVVFYFMCLVLVCFFALCNNYFQAFCVGALMIIVLIVTSFRRMQSKVERREIIERIEGIVAGESVRVEESHLSTENAALGHAVNEIGEGIRVAVEKSTKDERLKAELLTNVSHDIKTPLTSIINYVDLLKKEKIESEKALEYIEVLDTKSQKLKNLIQDLIEVSKISTGNIEYEMVPINLHELIMQAAAEYDEKFNEHCLKLIYNNEVKDAVILADSRRMWRVMENLLSNVYKYALEGTRVYMEVARAEEEIVFTVKNISAKEIKIQADELTERFVRGDLSRTTEGSGLGLAIAQNLVLGQGGTFKIMLDGDLFKVAVAFKEYNN